MLFLIFGSGSFAVQYGDHLRSGIICGPIWGSFAVRDHLRSWDHLRTRTVWLQTELDDTKSYYQLIIKITISEKRKIAKLCDNGKIYIKKLTIYDNKLTMSDNKLLLELSDNKLSDDNLASELVGNRSF